MAIVDGHQPRIRNETCQDAAIGDRHERIVGRLVTSLSWANAI
jgi:hypothetical protein